MPQLETSTYFSQIFWLFISFSLLFLIMSKLFIPRIMKIFADRELQISENLRAAKLAKDEAALLKNECEKLLEQAMQQREDNLSRIKHDIASMFEENIHKQESDLNQMLKDAEARIKAFEKTSETEVKKIAVEASEAILKELGAKSPNQKLISEAINKNFSEEKYVI